MSSTERGTYWGPCTQYGLVAFPEQRAVAEQKGWKVDGQEEIAPTTGRKHIQFWVKTPQVRMSEVKKVFQGAHIEVARNVKAVKNYCQKEDTRSGSLPQASDKYPNQDKLFNLFGVWVCKHLPMSRKHGVLYNRDGYVQKVSGDTWLQWFDECCGELIEKGYRVESLAVNPAIRSAIKKFGNAIFARYRLERDGDVQNPCAVDRQTDRQTEIISVPVYTDENAGGSNEDTAPSPESDASSRSESGEDYEDCDGASSSRHTQSTDAHGSEAGDISVDTE